MTIIFDNRNWAQNEMMADWLKGALENAKDAVLLSGASSSKKSALVHVQQSAEIATKGIAIGMGMPYKDVVKFGHNNLELSGKIIDEVMKKTSIKPFLDTIMPGDSADEALRALDTILKPKDNPEFRSSMQLTPPVGVKSALDLINNINLILERDAPGVERSVRETIALFNVSELYDENSEFMFPPGIVSWLKDQGMAADALKDLLTRNRRLIHPEGDHSSEASDSDDMRHMPLEVVLGKIKAILKVVAALIKLFLVGGLVWPHYTPARYPAPPDSARLGAQHYNDEIGVIRYIRELSRSILEAVETINDCLPPHLKRPEPAPTARIPLICSTAI